MIRELTLNDIERIAEIEQQEQIIPINYRTLYNWFSSGTIGWGLEKDGVLYGYTIASHDGHEAYSLVTCISKEYQNQKEGRALCLHALQEAKKLGLETVVFEVRESNVAELGMVKHFGAFCVGEKPNYYGNENALIMRINLGDIQ